MIYVKLPFTPFEPVGGVRTVFDYVMRLNAMAGKTIATVLADSNHLKGWLPDEYKDVPVRSTAAKVLATDTLFLVEVIATEAADYKHVTDKRLLVLNWKYLSNTLTTESLKALGYTKILTNSRYSQQLLQKRFKTIEVIHIPHVIRTLKKSAITPINKRAQHSFLILNRKNTQHIPGILKFLEGIRHTATIVNNVHPSQMPKLYAKHQYFINLGYPEGFCRPAAEAMAAGCIVIGFTGGGGSDFMNHNENCFIAPDGDEKKLIELINSAIHLPESEKTRMSQEAYSTIANQYDDRFQMQALHTTFAQQIDKPFRMPKTKSTGTKKKTARTTIMNKSQEILEYQMFQQKQQYQELTQSKIFAIWQAYVAIKDNFKKFSNTIQKARQNGLA